MREILDYMTVSSISIRNLDDEINRAITHGWQPYGSIFEPKEKLYLNHKYFQPMVKYKD